MTRTLSNRRLSRTSCSILALATVMAFGATPAHAQFVGTIDSSTGIDTVNSDNGNLLITGQQAVINWTATDAPSGGQIVFLPDGNPVTFSGASDFAVLNRVNPGTSGNAIYMGGIINSLAGDVTGGTVYFYSPDGIVIGANASINVGSLGLTTLPIADDGQGNWMTDFGGSNPKVEFGQATNPNSYIRTEAAIDGSINANGTGNYVALVAPVINHSGTIRTDSGAVLVAAEAASITFSDSGLYNIEVSTGSEALQSLTVNGGKIIRNSEAIGGDRHAYLVAVPKNDVTTMLISGGAEMGFDIAGSAGVEGNTVVLNAGFNTVDEFGVSYLADTTGNLTIDNASFTSNVETIAHGDTQITTYNGATSFSGNLDITNDFNAFVGATASDLTITGDLDIHTFYLWSVFEQPKVTLWAGSGATLSTGNVDIRANTHGSNAPDEFSPGESVTGGEINLTANDGGHILVNGSLYGEVTGTGGAQDYFGGVGGNGIGGTINVSALGAGSSIDAGTTELYAYGNGGSSSECLSCNISGGIGHGGVISIVLDQGAASMAFGALNTWATGQGGYGAGGNGGDGIGGSSTVSIGGGSTLAVNGNYFNFADGAGGNAEGAGTAGNGHGGTAGLLSTAGGGQIFFTGSDAYFTADAMGGIADGTGDGGDAFTGSATINVTDTTIAVANPQQVQPFGRIYVKANAYGGTSAGGAGGLADATTGTVSMTIGANSTLSAGRLISTLSEATGGQGISGGTAKGGTGGITVNSGGIFTGAVSQLADATGGLGTSGQGGNATGGIASFNMAGGTATLGSIESDASGQGGYGSNGGNGGAGAGGRAGIYGNGGVLTVNGDTSLDASGYGGGSGVVAGGTGGSGTGGIAEIYVPSGTANLNGNLFAEAYGEGGDALGGVGAAGLGGSARVQSDGGAIHITGNLSLDGGAIGGDGATGGDATGRVSPPETEFQPTAVMVTTNNNGSVDVDGVSVLSAEAVGGNGGNGSGGNAQAGEADVITFVGSIDLNSLSIDVNAYGGSGANGGSGGNAVGGPVDVAFGLGAAPILGTITLGSATIAADGEGGAGGAGTIGTTGGNGGAGGNGSGGRISFTGSAAGGTLSSGVATLTSLGTGGAGGAGGTGSAGAGGNGGAGGIGTGGGMQTGTISNENSPNSGGGATYTTMSLNASAVGGDGGAGGTGSSANGIGGNGGEAVGGSASFLARGVLVSADTVTITANATGGDGGLGSTQGNGGNAQSGSFSVEAKDRFGHIDERGTLEADSVTGEAIAAGGTGAVDGVGSVIGSTYFRVLNGDADIGSVNFNTAGDVYNNTFANSTVSVREGTATIGDFTFTTTGELALDASNGSMNAGSITLSAGTFIPDAFSDNESGAQAGPGTYSANTFDISTGGDFITNAHLVSTGSLAIIAPGLIGMRDATSGGDLTLQAGSTINGGTQTAAGSVLVSAPGNITLGNVVAGNLIDMLSDTGDISLGFLSAGTSIYLEAAGGIGFGDVTADDLDFSAGGGVNGGDILTATQATGEAQGAIVLGDISVGIQAEGGAAEDGFAVGITSATSIVVGDVEADESIGFATFGPLTTGNLTTTGGDILALASGNVALGAMSTGASGQIYIADSSMFIAAGGPDDFVPSQVFNSPLVPTGGSVTLGGPVNTSTLRVAAGGLLSINGSVNSQGSTLISGDIDLANGITVDGSTQLVSINSQGSFVGDGLTGTGGYRLSNAEYNQFLQDVSFEVRPDLGAAALLTIGDLDIGAGVGDADFGIEDDNDNDLGTIRVVGDVVMHNGESGDLFFESETFQLDAATGSILISSDGTTPGGRLSIAANNIHVAEGSILDQLAQDPQYEGYRDDLNAPAETQRPEGVIKASIIDLEFGDTPAELYTLYVQNTGTAETPAGFVISELGLDGGDEGGLPPNSLDVVINGQIETGEGTLTGADVRDALVESEEGDLTPFTANSMVNGCLLSGPCVQTPDNPLPPDFTPTPGIQQEIVLLGDDDTPPPPFGNEDIIDDNDEETEDTSPIVPPQPLFDTSELGEADTPGNPRFGTTMRSSPGIKQDGDVDDPVSGSGNPGLMETPPPPANGKEMQP